MTLNLNSARLHEYLGSRSTVCSASYQGVPHKSCFYSFAFETDPLSIMTPEHETTIKSIMKAFELCRI